MVGRRGAPLRGAHRQGKASSASETPSRPTRDIDDDDGATIDSCDEGKRRDEAVTDIIGDVGGRMKR